MSSRTRVAQELLDEAEGRVTMARLDLAADAIEGERVRADALLIYWLSAMVLRARVADGGLLTPGLVAVGLAHGSRWRNVRQLGRWLPAGTDC